MGASPSAKGSQGFLGRKDERRRYRIPSQSIEHTQLISLPEHYDRKIGFEEAASTSVACFIYETL